MAESASKAVSTLPTRVANSRFVKDNQATETQLSGQSATEIGRMRFASSDYSRRLQSSASILCKSGEGDAWFYRNMDEKGRTMWQAASGKSYCNVDPVSLSVVRR